MKAKLYSFNGPLQGGSVIRLFHKELEAYLVAEGLFEDCVTEDGKCTVYMVWNWKPYDIEIFC